jgi:D-tyrosyl-tRNA(Tyr) deacylase
MRAVIQRVLHAEVKTAGQTVGQIGKGLLVYLSVAAADTEKDARFIAEKLANLRIFPDETGKMNKNALDLDNPILLISNFTLHGDCRKGRRPALDNAAKPQLARQLYEKVARLIAEQGLSVQKGLFGEYMLVTSANDGPLTFLLDSSRLF